MRSRVIDIDDLSDCLSKSSIDDEVYENDSEWIHPFYKKLESKQTSYLAIQKTASYLAIQKTGKRKRDDSDQENLKKIRIDPMIPIENVVQDICGKSNLDDLTIKELKAIIAKKKLDIPNVSRMLKSELLLAVENALYYNEYCDESEEESNVIKVQSVQENNTLRDERRRLRNLKRTSILKQQEIQSEKKKRIKSEVFDLSVLFSDSL
jgi:hypothetical protein